MTLVFGAFSPIMLLRATTVVLLLSSMAAPSYSAPKAKGVKKEESSKKATPAPAEPFLIEPNLGHARTYFRRHEYRLALNALEGKVEGLEALLIAAESNFRLENYEDAKRHFEEIISTTNDPIERRKAQIRLFDIEIKTKDTQSAINRYVAFTKEYKKPSSQMRYSLGKALFDVGYFERAEKILRVIPKDSEFYMRARYMVATIGLEKKKPEVNAKIFGLIENLTPISVEDHSVRQLAILAQGRIYAEAGKEELAAKAYARVQLSGEFGETATIESVRAMLLRAAEARLSEGRFKKVAAFRRNIVEKEAIGTALATIARYRKTHEVDWRKPELLTLMAQLYVEAKRYDDARLAYEELIGHYRPIYDELLSNDKDKDVWHYFALDLDRDLSKKRRSSSMIIGVPEVLVKDIPEVKDILALRDRIEEGEQKLINLEERAFNMKVKKDVLSAARSRQNGLVNAYKAMVIKKQKRFRELVAANINLSLAEAEFKRAELVVLERADLKKQQNVVHDFQSEKIDAFESYLKKLDEGGSS